MIKGMLSVVIPSRNGQLYTQKTIDDLLEKAEGEIEVIVVLDGWWPDPPLKDDKRVKIIHQGIFSDNFGMRDAVNMGMRVAQGEFVMKTDEHTMFDKGFDTKLKADCEDNWVVIPRRYRLNADDWKLEEYDLIDGIPVAQPGARPPVDYAYIAYPYERPRDKTCGLHGAEWKQRHFDRKDILIDETMSFQGSCYFMKKSFWDSTIGDLDSDGYGTFTQEPQEVGNKAWFSGGKVMVNKKTWYAHMHKGKRGKGYGFNREQYEKHGRNNEKGRLYCVDHWLNNKWDKRVMDWEDFLNMFSPVPTWPLNWKDTVGFDKNKERVIKNRLDLAQYFNELGLNVGAEVGVYRGYYSEVLLKANPNLKLYSVDPWMGKKGYRTQEQMDQFYARTVQRLSPYKGSEIMRMTSEEASKLIPDESLDFVYIDAGHDYEDVIKDLEYWTPKVKKGGIVAGDDYYIFGSGNDGVVRAVNEFTDRNRVMRTIIDWDNNFAKRDDSCPQWFFFKLNDYR